MGDQPDMPSRGSAFPIEPLDEPSAPARLGFATGIAMGVILSAIAAQLWTAIHLAPIAGTWSAFAPDSIGNLSRLAVTPAWRWGVPSVTAAALAVMVVVGGRRARWYALLAAVAVVAPVVTYEWAVAPWHDVAAAVR